MATLKTRTHKTRISEVVECNLKWVRWKLVERRLRCCEYKDIRTGLCGVRDQ